MKKCPKCKGYGTIWTGTTDLVGVGFSSFSISRDPCLACDGSGKTSDEKETGDE